MSRFGRRLPRPAAVVDTIAGTSTSPFVKSCGCGRSFTLAEWRRLPFVGEQRFEAPPYRLELRDCRCGSTIALWTDRDGVPCDDDGNPITESAADLVSPRPRGEGRAPLDMAGARPNLDDVRAALNFAEGLEP